MWQCPECLFLYDPNAKTASGVDLEDLPDNWICPQCATPKDRFEKIGGDDDE